MGTRLVEGRRRLPAPPVTLAVVLAIAAAFGLALLIGWTTAGTREDLRKAEPQPQSHRVPALVLLGRAAALPAPPPARAAAARPSASPKVPRLIVGSG